MRDLDDLLRLECELLFVEGDEVEPTGLIGEVLTGFEVQRVLYMGASA